MYNLAIRNSTLSLYLKGIRFNFLIILVGIKLSFFVLRECVIWCFEYDDLGETSFN